MECNKEEAFRAKDIAIKKLESKDFPVAHKFALKAQKLYPDLENIGQLLAVCDVHCSAEQKLYGNEINWYKVLQIEMTADEVTIKKQYRKFALQLHPDKNKFSGAEAAFKLIGEAQRVLLDRVKRSDLDRKCRVAMNNATMPSRQQQKAHMNFKPTVQNTVKPNFMNTTTWQGQQSRQTSQQELNGGRPTFWTICSFCSVRYQYYREVMNRSLRCQQCNRVFFAYDVGSKGATPATNPSPQASGQQNNGFNHGASNVGVGSQGNVHANKFNTESRGKKRATSDVSRKPIGKRRKQESSESADSVSSDSEDDVVVEDNGFTDVQKNTTSREKQPRRSARQKHQASNKVNASASDSDNDDDDDESFQPSSRYKRNGSSNRAGEMNNQNGLASENEDNKEVRRKEGAGVSNIDEASADLVYPDPQFSDFDKDKKEENFKAEQVWAMYDTTDGMPRFYAMIKKVLSPRFKLQIRWFESDPDDEDEINWSNEELPIACGKYKLGKTEIYESREAFSHQILWEKTGRNTFKVYPRKGETWALFKDWDIKWYVDAESHQKYDFEFVEILSDFVEGEGVDVAHLAKLKGFVSLFCPIMKEGNCSSRIPSAQLFRFSHRVPSFRMTGQEGLGVPVGSFEFDPLSLPMNLEEEIDLPQDLKAKSCHSPSVGVSTRSSDAMKFKMKSDSDASPSKVNLERRNSALKNKASVDHIDDGVGPSDSVTTAVGIPDSQFFNFHAKKSPENFQIGQVWAFYRENDRMPRYYGVIMGVGTSPDLDVRVTWLTNYLPPKDAVKWEDEDMIISCGQFKTASGASSSIVCKNTHSFSHELHPVAIEGNGKNKKYTILPRKGEVWALYKKWSAKIRSSDLSNCEYDIVEVVDEDNSSGIKVLYLEKLSGFNSVFKGKTGGRSSATIPSKRFLMFSHQIPAFRLTEEHGDLASFLELDPAALPTHYFSSK